ncbi:para-nitrobenzyl esterase [Pseudoduganella lurida]|uniref:Carboxylic ester hydrolase n=1 Tax=Pseudoduganella lurida TaxID=1036180 RepID=A0A562R236_9BURK|nr:carboxylesterase family protein [Pseudoduganella lurida]TWI62530.1 para-nitrobenzyl esterase [Pseudoduganella lurida]
MIRHLMIAGLVLGTISMAAAQPIPLQVKTDSGLVGGIDQDGMQAWLGIPYAAAPVGKLRWMPPQRPQPWSAVRDAKSFGNYCPQNEDLGVFGKPGGREDCLNLNVYVGKDAVRRGKKLPVFVWIHGGSLFVGANRDYDASKLAKDGNAVVVTINYRLGLLGYFAHPVLNGEGHAFANYGFMDQQMALDWVQRNIAAFGGDKGNVTIAGESSGGNSVLAHVAAPGSRGNFQHAIAMSGGAVALKFPAFGAPKPLDFAEKMGTGFARAAGCESGDAAACLRALPVATVLAMQTPYLINQVIIDGTVMPMHPAEAYRSGKFNHVTLINGSTRDEGGFFAGAVENLTQAPLQGASYDKAMSDWFGTWAEEVKKAYPVSDYTNASEAYAAAVTDMEFACPGRAISRWVAAQTPTHAFEFADRTAPDYLTAPTSFVMGAGHSMELAYIFPGFHGGRGKPVKLNPLQEKLSDTMVRYWTSAAGMKDRAAEWPRYDPSLDNYMSLVLPNPAMTKGSFGRIHKCEFWQRSGVIFD